ncbi:MAG: FAD-dependent oxidoreductase, partial [Myxococcales bacterium]|nr:FAD-dependent oxidoreductase [Myxococcales bacterium]
MRGAWRRWTPGWPSTNDEDGPAGALAYSASMQETHEYDVVVVGSGGAGLAAALAAASAGASVAVLEAAEQPGGTTRRSGGGVWIPNNSQMRALGLEDPRDAALKLMAHLAAPARYDAGAADLGLGAHGLAMLETFYDRGAEVIDALTALGALDLMILPSLGFGESPISDPDYHAELPENLAPIGRVLTAKTPPGSMEWPGVFLVDGLLDALRGREIPLLLGHRVVDAVDDGQGRVRGVVVEHGGERRKIVARRGVVFAAGGFSHAGDKVHAHLRGPVFGTGAAAGDGVLLEIADRLGAKLANLANGFYFQVALEAALEHGGPIARPDAFVFLPYGDSMIIVDKRGRRIGNEKAMYHERTQSHFVAGYGEYPNLVQIMIWDAPVMQEPTFWPWRGG